MLFYNLKLKKFSRDLRKNMTDAEKMVWSRIRRRQPVISPNPSLEKRGTQVFFPYSFCWMRASLNT
jgi:hypothetical protein